LHTQPSVEPGRRGTGRPRTRRRGVAALLVAAVLVAAAACIPNFPDPPAVPPSILATTPARGGTGVPRATQVVLRFSEPMQAGTVSVSASPAIAFGAPQWPTPDALVLTPSAPLPAATTYSVSVSGTTQSGHALGAPTSFTFTTAPASATLAAGHPRLLLVGSYRTAMANAVANHEPAADRFRNVIDEHIFEGGTLISDYQSWWGALLGVLTADPDYCADSVARIDAWVASEQARIAAGQVPVVAGDSYLHVGDRIGDLALVWDWCFSATTPAMRTRWAALSNQAIFNVWNHTTASWGGVPAPWTGWGSDNPRNNYYLSFLEATVLWGAAAGQENATAASWLADGRTKVTRALAPIHTMETPGGGSLEGTGYGTALKNYWFLAFVWERSTGERWADLSSATRDTIAYLLTSIVPTRDRFAPIGDQSRVTEALLTDYQREGLLALAELYRGTPWGRAARVGINASVLPQMERPEAWVFDLLYGRPDAGSAQPMPTTYHAPGVGHVFSRSGTGDNATWLGFLAGPYVESHAHHDALSLLLYRGGWQVDDAGLHSGSGLINAEEAHALVMLEEGSTRLRMVSGGSAELVALRTGDGWVHMAGEVGDLYPGQGIEQSREVIHLAPNVVIVADRIDSGTRVLRRRFQLPTPTQPTVDGAGVVRTSGPAGGLALFRAHPQTATVTVQPYTALAGTLPPDYQDDFGGGYRTSVVTQGSGQEVFVHVIGLGGAATAVSRLTSEDGRGVTVTLADGRKATAWFRTGAIGGTLEVLGADGQPDVQTDLVAGVVPTS
jgi:hypothetical protein